ncbi:hypothetical protein [Paenibacillus sp. NPDC057967]|uniref:hypothetical protein n=1 Tax=Paenibacillus sp. NPDC057967 TaxID=3346293 RepID=UPI0036DF4ADF
MLIWLVIERHNADEGGDGFNMEVVADAREFAVRFLKEQAFRWDGSNIVEHTVRSRMGEAAKHYEIAALAFGQLREMFPFRHGGTPKDSEAADRAICRKQKAAKTKGVEQLEALFYFMKEYYSETWIN